MKYSSFLIILVIFSIILSACSQASATSGTYSTTTPSPQPTRSIITKTSPSPTPPMTTGSFESGVYLNLFKDLLGKSDAEIQAKLDTAWQQLFYGNDETERVYYPVGDDMAYIKDIGNGDIRSEGMSYGMMIAVQFDKQEEFNRIWKWTRTYMYQEEGPYQGYFAWHCLEDGTQIDPNPASDGEEWFVMALLFASGRWGDGEGIFDYNARAQEILHTMLHKEDTSSGATNMFNLDHHQVVFVPDSYGKTFTDPSYHLPAYYELWSRWANEDQAFWSTAAQSSREFFQKAANPKTGLMPDYANFDGTPYGADSHKDFRFDAFRIGQNIAVDYTWFAADPWQVEQSNRMLDFFYSQGIYKYANQYTLDGRPLSSDHSPGLVAMNAVVAMASTSEHRRDFVQALWDTSIPTGKWRYYDGLLYQIALLHVSGNFRIYPRQSNQK